MERHSDHAAWAHRQSRSQVFQHQPRADAGALEDHRQSAARMRAAADEIHAVEVFKTVVWAQVQHLIKTMRQIEGCAPINFVACVPVGGSDDAFVANAALNVTISSLGDLA